MIYWVITNGTKFIYREPSGKYVLDTIDNANRYKTKDAAATVLKTQLSKELRGRCFIAKHRFYEENKKRKREIKREKKQSKKKSAQKTNRIRFVFKNNDTGNIDYWLKKIDFEKNIKKEMSERKKVLVKMIKEIEDYTCDITHYIEFNTPNRNLGYKLELYLHELNGQRRLIKNEIIVIDLITEYLENTDFSSLKELKMKIKKEQNQWYYPRKLLPLFQEGTSEKTDDIINQFLKDVICICSENSLINKRW